MKIDEEKLDSRLEWNLQELLIDVAAVLAATEPGRAGNANGPKRSEYAVSRKFPPAWQTWSTTEIIPGNRRPYEMKEFEGQGLRTNVSFGAAGETILQQGFEQKMAEPRHTGPTIHVSLTMRSEIEAISPLVNQLMHLVRAGRCVSSDDGEVRVALREALAHAVLHGNRRDARKKVHVSCRIRPGKELSMVVRDEGSGFDPAKMRSQPRSMTSTLKMGKACA